MTHLVGPVGPVNRVPSKIPAGAGTARTTPEDITKGLVSPEILGNPLGQLDCRFDSEFNGDVAVQLGNHGLKVGHDMA